MIFLLGITYGSCKKEVFSVLIPNSYDSIMITQKISDCTKDKGANFIDLDNVLKSWSKEMNITLNSFVITTGLNCNILLILVNGIPLDIEGLKTTLKPMQNELNIAILLLLNLY